MFKSLFAKLFPVVQVKPSIASATAAFAQSLDTLRTVEANHLEEAKEQAAILDNAGQAYYEAMQTAKEARKIAAAFEKLLGSAK